MSGSTKQNSGHPASQTKMLWPDSTGSNGSPGSVQIYQREKPFSSRTATQVSMNILITSRILLLVTFIMALKGSERYSSVTQSL